MKNFALIIILSVFCTSFLFGQESTLKELSAFDKMIIHGNVEEVRLIPVNAESPLIKVKGADEANITATVVAGTLNLTIKDKGKPVQLEVFNGRLKRISGTADMKITGAEVIGGEAGNYLVVSYNYQHGGPAWAWAGQSFNIHIPDVNIPDIPDLPEMNFDIPELDFDFEQFSNEYNWEEHKDEIRQWSQEMNEEMKDAMKKAREEMERAREKIKDSKEE
ncbi:MAG: hypothetical protein WD555_01465 [Fulvivirga sp.]